MWLTCTGTRLGQERRLILSLITLRPGLIVNRMVHLGMAIKHHFGLRELHTFHASKKKQANLDRRRERCTYHVIAETMFTGLFLSQAFSSVTSTSLCRKTSLRCCTQTRSGIHPSRARPSSFQRRGRLKPLCFLTQAFQIRNRK